jgi:hypothetical protein
MLSGERGPEQATPLEQEAGRTSLAPETGREFQPGPPPDQRQRPGGARSQSALEVKQEDRWIAGYWRSEACALRSHLEELEGRLRRRTVVLGSGLALMTCATGVLLFSLVSLQQRPELAAAAPTREQGVEASIAVGKPEPAVQPPPSEQIFDNERQVKPFPERLAAHDELTVLTVPVMLRPEPRDRPPLAAAEIPPLPSLRTDKTAAAPATTSRLRARLSSVKQQIQGSLSVADPQAHSRRSPDVEAPEPPLVDLTSQEPPSETRPVPTAMRDGPSVAATSTSKPTLLSGTQR